MIDSTAVFSCWLVPPPNYQWNASIGSGVDLVAVMDNSAGEATAQLALLGNILAFILDTTAVASTVSGLNVGPIGVPDSEGVWDGVCWSSRDGHGDRGEDGEKGGELHFG